MQSNGAVQNAFKTNEPGHSSHSTSLNMIVSGGNGSKLLASETEKCQYGAGQWEYLERVPAGYTVMLLWRPPHIIIKAGEDYHHQTWTFP